MAQYRSNISTRIRLHLGVVFAIALIGTTAWVVRVMGQETSVDSKSASPRSLGFHVFEKRAHQQERVVSPALPSPPELLALRESPHPDEPSGNLNARPLHARSFSAPAARPIPLNQQPKVLGFSDLLEAPGATNYQVGYASSNSSSAGRQPNTTPNSSLNKKQAETPQVGESFFDPTPHVDEGVHLLPYFPHDFSPDPIYGPSFHEPYAELSVYGDKYLTPTQRPILECGRCLYPPGQFKRSSTLLGRSNLVTPQLLVYGDFRTAVSYIEQQGTTQTVWGNRLNLDIDLEITATERFHAFIGPLDRGAQVSRAVYDNGEVSWISELDGNFDFAYFEGDLGSLWGGFVDQVAPFTLPVAVGAIPMFVQNGYWIDDAFLGAAATIPARSSAALDWSNFDVTFFYGFDKLDSLAFQGDDNAARVYGVTSWIEAYGGYVELGYSFVEDRQLVDRSYHSLAAGYTWRFREHLSSGVRAIANIGQSPNGIEQTANGALLVWENSLITKHPWSRVPYFNFYAGLDRPQSVARNVVAGDILRNVGINFETDGLTGYPTLEATANNTWGGAIGMNCLPDDLSQQLITEFAFVQPIGSQPFRRVRGPQYGFGARYQLPLNNSWLIRVDGLIGLLDNEEDLSGFRVELRHKF